MKERVNFTFEFARLSSTPKWNLTFQITWQKSNKGFWLTVEKG